MAAEIVNKQMRILVVEDNPDDAELLDFKLQQLKHDFLLDFADTLQQAFIILGKTPFDLVLLDLSLPDCDGIETYTKVADRYPLLPVIVLTGSDDEALALQLLRLGALDFLVKDQVTTSFLTRSIKYAIERKQAQEMVTEQSERLLNALEIANVGSWDWNIQYDLTKWDKRTQQIFGITDDTKAPQCLAEFLQFVHIEDRVRVKHSIDEPLASGAFHEVEYRIITPAGNVRHVAARGRLLKDHNEQTERMLGTCIDITERIIAQQNDQKLALLEAREEFMATLTHDLKNPLLGAGRLLDLLTEHESSLSEEQKRELLWQLRDSNRHILMMIGNLTEVYCLEHDANALYFELINLSETLHATLNEMRPLVSNKNLLLSSNIHDHLPVKADRFSMQRVLQNLLSNALKFTGENGTIKVTATLHEGKISVEVEDSGRGISLNDQEHLFQRFGRGKSVRHSTPGTGLGLYYCKKIIEAHDGKIAYIHKDGKGAHFRAELPAAL
ncbi:MAG: response regulator [Candidatus Obscuribacter sp.]|nr:response regulator [Candidatus Obscuribacter sp.]